MKHEQVEVVIAMGSKTDMPTMKAAGEALEQFGISYRLEVLSAHRTPHEVASFAETAREKGVRVVIAGAGGAAHLPGMIAAYTELPVIGVPVPIGPLQGQDALLSIVQMPKGVPVATVAIGNAWNAGILSAQMMSANGSREAQAIADKILEYKKKMHDDVVGNSK